MDAQEEKKQDGKTIKKNKQAMITEIERLTDNKSVEYFQDNQYKIALIHQHERGEYFIYEEADRRMKYWLQEPKEPNELRPQTAEDVRGYFKN